MADGRRALVLCLAMVLHLAWTDQSIYRFTQPLVPLYDDANDVTRTALDMGFTGYYPARSCGIHCWRNRTHFCTDPAFTLENRTHCREQVWTNQTILNGTAWEWQSHWVYHDTYFGCDIRKGVCPIPGVDDQCTNQTFKMVPQMMSNGTHEVETMVPACEDKHDPCGYCNLNYTYCAPPGVAGGCIRSLNDGDYFETRSIRQGEIHTYKVDVLTHDSYCCKYHKHCARNVLFVKAESCDGAVSMYIDIKRGASPSQYVWKSAHGAASGFVEKINFPIYHHKYYISIRGDAVTGPRSNGLNTYTLYSSTSPQENAQVPGCGGYIKLKGAAPIDKNVPEIINMKIEFCGMREPLGRPIAYHLYWKTFTDKSLLQVPKGNLASPCAMKLNGKLLQTVKSKSFGVDEEHQRYTIDWTIDKTFYYALNIYAVNDVGIGKAYQVFLSAPPAGDLDVLTDPTNQAIGGGVFGAFLVSIVCIVYWGKVRPGMIEGAQRKGLEERKLLEEEKASAGDKKKSRNKNKKKAKEGDKK